MDRKSNDVVICPVNWIGYRRGAKLQWNCAILPFLQFMRALSSRQNTNTVSIRTPPKPDLLIPKRFRLPNLRITFLSIAKLSVPNFTSIHILQEPAYRSKSFWMAEPFHGLIVHSPPFLTSKLYWKPILLESHSCQHLLCRFENYQLASFLIS